MSCLFGLLDVFFSEVSVFFSLKKGKTLGHINFRVFQCLETMKTYVTLLILLVLWHDTYLGLYLAGIDTVGDVRIPASFCGILGFRPSYGSVSQVGIIPVATSLDTVGMYIHIFYACSFSSYCQWTWAIVVIFWWYRYVTTSFSWWSSWSTIDTNRKIYTANGLESILFWIFFNKSKNLTLIWDSI